jgi:hypothetical protein
MSEKKREKDDGTDRMESQRKEASPSMSVRAALCEFLRL